MIKMLSLQLLRPADIPLNVKSKDLRSKILKNEIFSEIFDRFKH